MNGQGEPILLVQKPPSSPRPPAVGKEYKVFHDTFQFPKYSKNPASSGRMEDYRGNYDIKDTLDMANCQEMSPNPSPPPPYKWAQSLQCLLEDIQGVEMFKQFLKQEGHETSSLSFWFACRGVKKTDPNDREKLNKLINAVFVKKVKRIPTISPAVKNDIKRKLSSGLCVDVNIFDSAQQEVEAHMLNTTYPNFLNSDLYIQLLRQTQGQGRDERECPVSPEAVDLLPTVHEDSELHISVNKLQSLKEAFWMKRKNIVPKAKPEGQTGLYIKSPYASYSGYHTKYGSYLPASAVDSELQSLSSDAQTDDTMSQADSSVDYSMHRSKTKRQQKGRCSSIINNDKLSNSIFIPRTQRPLPSESSLNKNAKEFHAVLCQKLNKLLDSQKAEEKVSESLKAIEDSYNSQRVSNHRTTIIQSILQPNIYSASEDNDQAILDQHVSRVFEDTGLTPVAMSPVCASPPVARPYCNDHRRVTPPVPIAVGDALPQDLSCGASVKVGEASPFTVPYMGRVRRDPDTRSNDSGALADWISEDNLSQSQRNADIENNSCSSYSQQRRIREKHVYTIKKLSTLSDSSISFVDSGISMACESVQPCHSKVAHWLESKRCSSEAEKDHQWKNSSTSPVLSRSSSSRKAVNYGSSRPGVLDSGNRPFVPSQPLAQDPFMPVLPPPDTTTNLIEARRRLEDERAKAGKPKYVSASRSFHDVTRLKVSSRNAGDPIEDGISHRKQSKKSDSGPSSVTSNEMTIIGYSFGRGSVPYKSRLPGKNVTLRQFKSLLNKKGNFKYFFKRVSDDFGTGVVLEEVTDDFEILPLWEGKVFCVIESMDENALMADD